MPEPDQPEAAGLAALLEEPVTWLEGSQTGRPGEQRDVPVGQPAHELVAGQGARRDPVSPQFLPRFGPQRGDRSGRPSCSFPQDRQRAATSSQRAASWLAAMSSCRIPAGIDRPISSAAPATAVRALATVASSASWTGTPASTCAPAAEPTSTRNLCWPALTSSVSARS